MSKKYPNETPLEEAFRLWKELRDIPVNGDEEIEIPFEHFDIGTNREDIWEWFEDTYDVSIEVLKGNILPAVDVIASGYDWICPMCTQENHEIEIPATTLECTECFNEFRVGNIYHAYD